MWGSLIAYAAAGGRRIRRPRGTPEFALLACPWRGICWAVFGLSSTRLTGKEGAVQSIHSFCGKPCGKKGHEDWNSLISNGKDQAAHK